MTIDEYIDDFLRDAQYRIGVLSSEMDDLKDEASYGAYKKLFDQRSELITFMRVVYEGKWYITDGYNHINYVATSGTETGWTEREVIKEIEYLRYNTNMNEVPFVTFTAHYPQIVNSIGGGSGSGTELPAGAPGYMIFYNASSQAYTDSVDSTGGADINESINSYFSGRLISPP